MFLRECFRKSSFLKKIIYRCLKLNVFASVAAVYSVNIKHQAEMEAEGNFLGNKWEQLLIFICWLGKHCVYRSNLLGIMSVFDH